jgi:hypothetical protein
MRATSRYRGSSWVGGMILAVYDDGSMHAVDPAHYPRLLGGVPSHSLRRFNCGRTSSLPPLLSLSLPPSLSSSFSFFFPRISSHFLAFPHISTPLIAFPRYLPPLQIADRHIKQVWARSCIPGRLRKYPARPTTTSGEYSMTTPDVVYIFMFECRYGAICCRFCESLSICLYVF